MRLLATTVLLLLMSCGNGDDDIRIGECGDAPAHTGAKINGGSVLQVFFLASENSKGTDIMEKTNADWLAMSPLIGLMEGNSGNYRPYRFPVSQEIFKMRNALENVVSSGVRNVMLKPLTSFAGISDSNFWGDFYLETEEEWGEMELAYTGLFLGFAELSEEFPEVRMLSIGNELREFATRRPEFFKGLIARLREDHPNLVLTYSANWDEYHRIAFWDDLDYIGVNSYFDLVDERTPAPERVVEAFQPVKADLEALSCDVGRPVLFTEYGFRSIDYNLRRPWDHGSINRDNVNLRAQANAYTGFFDTFWDEPWVAGGFFWEWFVEVDIENPSFPSADNGWYINGKPAEEIVRGRYSGDPAERATR